MTWRLISSEKASPLMLRAYRPSAWANLWKAALLCQPGVPGGWLGRALEEHAQRLRAACEGRADARGQAVAGGRADHQHALGRAGDGTLLAHVVDLLAHIGLAAGGMGGHADETAHAGLMTRRTPSWAARYRAGIGPCGASSLESGAGPAGRKAKMRRALYGSRARGGQLTGCRRLASTGLAGGGPAAPPFHQADAHAAGADHGDAQPGQRVREMAPDQPAHGGGADDLQVDERRQRRGRRAPVRRDLEQVAQPAGDAGGDQQAPVQQGQLAQQAARAAG